MKLPKPNPDHIQSWNDADYARLLVLYYNHYQNSFQLWEHDSLADYRAKPKADRVWFSRINHYGGRRVKWYLLHELYLEGHIVEQKLKCDFQEFCNYMIYGVPTRIYNILPESKGRRLNHYLYWRWRARTYFIDSHFRKQQKFKQTGNFKTKVKSEHQVAKEEWHEIKGHNRDRRKVKYRRGCPRDIKRMCNKQHRQWERDNIQHDNWEELSNPRKWKEILDPWKWD